MNSIALNHLFHALSDPTRREILRRLTDTPLTVSVLASGFSMSLPAVAKHVRNLEKATLIRTDKRGRERYCTLNPAALDAATDWLQHCREDWEARLDRLADYFDETDASR